MLICEYLSILIEKELIEGQFLNFAFTDKLRTITVCKLNLKLSLLHVAFVTSAHVYVNFVSAGSGKIVKKVCRTHFSITWLA